MWTQVTVYALLVLKTAQQAYLDSLPLFTVPISFLHAGHSCRPPELTRWMHTHPHSHSPVPFPHPLFSSPSFSPLFFGFFFLLFLRSFLGLFVGLFFGLFRRVVEEVQSVLGPPQRQTGGALSH
jgi:hypothetical protein